jgi:transposase
LDTDPTFGVFFMAKYDEKFKLSVVREYESGKWGIKTLGKRHDLDAATLRKWVKSYQQHGEQGLRKKFSHYSAQFKLNVLQRMRHEELSARQALALFDIRGGVGVISTWARQYHEGGLDALRPKPRGRPKTMTRTKPAQRLPPQLNDAHDLQTLRKENEYLRAEVAYLKKLQALVQAKRQAAQTKRKPSLN